MNVAGWKSEGLAVSLTFVLPEHSGMEEALEQMFWQLFDEVLLSFEVENQIIEEIILNVEDDDWENYEDLYQQMNVVDHEDLNEAVNAVVGELMELEILELEAEEEAVLELIYHRNARVYDWRAQLPRMEYLRDLEDPTFLQHFRMDRCCFERLIVVMGNHLAERGRLIRLRTEVDKTLLMALWILFNMDTFRATGVIFGVSRGTVHFHYIVVIEALRELTPRYIKWPSQQERDRIKRHIEDRTGYPGVVGMIDGTLIRITAPAVQKERYYDRHQSYSLNVQAVCDDNLLYRDVYLGQPGSVHDMRVFERSALYDLLLERRQDVMSDDEHIIGDGGYECMEKLLIPYRDLGNMTVRQRRYNFVHSSNRMKVERSFGSLKGKCRRLLKLCAKRFVYALDHIMSSFVIHNFIILEGRDADGVCVMHPHNFDHLDDPVEEVNEEDEDEDAIRDRPEGRGGARNRAGFQHPLLAQSKLAGARKREVIADQLYQLLLENQEADHQQDQQADP